MKIVHRATHGTTTTDSHAENEESLIAKLKPKKQTKQERTVELIHQIQSDYRRRNKKRLNEIFERELARLRAEDLLPYGIEYPNQPPAAAHL
ncbi:hypothetical protein GCM10027037_03290 [Mucilaginibacter koreensis]